MTDWLVAGIPGRMVSPAGLTDTIKSYKDSVKSVALKRLVRLEVIVPPGYHQTMSRLPVLYLNDGQDLPRLQMNALLDSLYQQQAIQPFVLVAIYASDRIQEYGTAAQADYAGRGSKAGTYTAFVLNELLPYIQKKYRVTNQPAQSAFAGFSLGGLSAFDIVWNHPARFSKAGAFSGSFWWRSKALDKGYTDNDRIMQGLVRAGTYHKSQQFWLQTGTADETSDRDQDGVIDSIDDTLGLIAELERKGCAWGKAIRYVEVKGGQHNQETWSAVMPDFLVWAFKKL